MNKEQLLKKVIIELKAAKSIEDLANLQSELMEEWALDRNDAYSGSKGARAVLKEMQKLQKKVDDKIMGDHLLTDGRQMFLTRAAMFVFEPGSELPSSIKPVKNLADVYEKVIDRAAPKAGIHAMLINGKKLVVLSASLLNTKFGNKAIQIGDSVFDLELLISISKICRNEMTLTVSKDPLGIASFNSPTCEGLVCPMKGIDAQVVYKEDDSI